MIILQSILLIIVIKLYHAEFLQEFHPFNPAVPPVVSICPPTIHHHQHKIASTFKFTIANTTSLKDSLKFLVPFIDMDIQYDRNIYIMQEVLKQQIYILHGSELYQLFISRREKRLSLMGYLEGNVRHVEPLGAQIIYWQGNLILVIALEEHLEVYQLAETVLKERAEIVKDFVRANESPPTFEAIQRLMLTGKFQKLFLFSTVEEQIMIIAAVNFTELYGKFRTFEWFDTYFDPIEELVVPSIYVANVIGSQIKYLVTGCLIKHHTRTILTVYEINQSTLRLQAKQTLTVQSQVIHIFTYRDRNMIVACSNKDHKCSSFRQTLDGHFSVYRQRTHKEFAFDLLTSAKNFVAATRQNQIMIFTNHRLDCYGSFISDQMAVTSLLGQYNLGEENYVLLVYKRPFKVLIRIVELEINAKDLSTGVHSEPEEMLASMHHKHLFETIIGQLRSVLLKRKVDMDILRKVSNIITTKMKKLDLREPVTLHMGNVDIIKIVGKALKSPQQILKKVAKMRQTYLPERLKRSDNRGPANISLEIINRVKINRLKVNNLIYRGDIVEGFHLKQTNKGELLLYVKPRVKTYSLNTSELILPSKLRNIREKNISDIFFDPVPSSVRVNHLRVEFINGISWNDFFESLFLKNRDKMVQGRLVLQSQVIVNHLNTTILNGLVVSNLFNLKYPQVVYSDLIISHLFVHDLKAKTINGLVFEEDIVFSGYDTLIETPVIMYHLNVSGDLLLADKIKVVRSNELEFEQFYTNKVIINGSLILNHLKKENGNKTKIMVGDQEFNENDIKTKYLLREEAQNFSFPIIFDESKVTAPFLETSYLNDYITEQYMMVNKVDNDRPLLVVFMNAHVQGDVICRDYKSKIAEIKKNIIHLDDKIINITGTKIFKAPIEASELHGSVLNHIPIEHLIFKSLINDKEIFKFKDLKTFLNIKVKNPAFIEMELQASYLNNLPLEDLLNNDYYMNRLQVHYMVETSNIVFHKINGIPFYEFFKKINVKDGRLVLHKDLIVEGNVQFAESLELEIINNVFWNEYVDNLVRINENAVIKGDVCFTTDLTITKEFETGDINGYDLETILKNVLMKNKPQLITGLYHFDNINVSNIDVLIINEVNVSEFIDSTKNRVEFVGDIIVKNLNIYGNMRGNIYENMNFQQLREKVRYINLRPWKNIYVLNNISWHRTLNDNFEQVLLKYFYKTAVKSNQNQVITGNVKISKPLIIKMQTRLQFPSNVDIDFIHQDGLLKNSSILQSVKGKKIFLKSLYMEKLQAKSSIYTKLLNNIDITRFNQSLYRLTSLLPLQGPLKFLNPLTIDHLKVNSLINGLNSSLIYQYSPNSTLPSLKFYELYIDNILNIKHINDMNLNYFLDNRIHLQGAALEHFGILTFENLVIEKEALIQSINNISIDNLIFKHSDYLQTISGHKEIEKSLKLAGPAHVMRLNDKDLMELYRSSLLKDQNYQFDNLVIDKVTFEKGLQIVKNLSGNFQQRSSLEFEQINSNSEDFLQYFKKLKTNLTFTSKGIIYLDYDLNTAIKWNVSYNSAKINKTILYELSRISCCEKQYLQISFQHPNEIYLQNITSNRVKSITNKISVKAENYCKVQYGKVKSKITISGHKLLKVFGMKRYIESIYILDIDNSTNHFVILHGLDFPLLKRNEVRILKIIEQNNTVNDWQGLIQNVGEQLKFNKLSDLKVLITNGLIEHHPALTIYHFNNTTHLFKLQQVIDGDYDIIEMLELPYGPSKSKQLIISCSKCQRIFIYELNSSIMGDKYEIFQIITLKSLVDKLVIFGLQNDYYMLIVSQGDSNFFTIYKYSYIQGWLYLTFGYFPNLYNMSIPLSELWNIEGHLVVSHDLDGIPLLLLCNLDDCYLVKAIV